jgi:hypothetical protein
VNSEGQLKVKGCIYLLMVTDAWLGCVPLPCPRASLIRTNLQVGFFWVSNTVTLGLPPSHLRPLGTSLVATQLEVMMEKKDMLF